MSALTFDKSELGNLEYSLQREMLSTDRLGGYMSTTIVCCNTRKYHGLMVSPIDDSDRTYVLLSSLDETVIQHDQSFNLALHRYPGVYERAATSTSPTSSTRRPPRLPTVWAASYSARRCSGFTSARSS